MYSIGQKVVCIAADFPEPVRKFYTALPVENAVYTVRDVLPGINLDGKTHEVAILLEELVNPVLTKHEAAFNVERFAPLDPTSETDEESASEPLQVKDLVFA